MYSGNAGMSVGGVSITGTCAAQARALDDAQSSVDGLLKRLVELREQVITVADSTLGVEPQPGNISTGQDTPPSGRINGLRRSLSAAHDLMSAIEGQFGRFNAL